MSSRASSELSVLLFALLLWASSAAAQIAPATSASKEASATPATEAAPDEQAEGEGEESTTPAMPATETDDSDADSQPGLRVATATAGARVDSDEEEKQPKSCGSGSIALSSGGCTKPWRVIGYAEYRQLAVTDDDPAAGRSLRMFLQGNYRIGQKQNVQLWGRIRYLQNFVAEEGESAARFQDPILGLDYVQQLSYADRGAEWVNIFMQHRLTGTIPVQRETRANDLYTRIGALERARIIPIPSLYIGSDLNAGYNFYQYAEQPGQQGKVNPQADFSGMLVVEWYPFQSERYGSILLGADGGVGYAVNYKGRGGALVEQENRWNQNYNWDLYGYYMPIPQLWLGAGVSQGAGLLRDGVAVVDFVNRDATQLSFNMVALY